jgi:hypothetical protein
MLTKEEILTYEVHSSRWAGWISFEWVQDLSSHYFAWKVNRKWARYLVSMEAKHRLKSKGII